ncbi:fimbrial protein [Pseudomonas alkylphenolica]|uniref:fimbrial protein n=1 Tax=Pseudomonas alkylphenolica TaxID=237609 RepID=UPI00315E01AA
MNTGNLLIGKLAVGVLGIAAIMFGIVDTAHAFCEVDSRRSISFFGPGDISVPRDTPDGTVLYSETKVLPLTTFRCTTQELWGFNLASGRGTPPGRGGDLFPFGVPGLSFRIKANLGSGMGYIESLSPLAAGMYKLERDMILEVVKSGPLAPSNAVNAGGLGLIQYGYKEIVELSLGRAINLVTAACETPDVSVAMGEDYKLVDFDGPGSTTREVPFSLKLNNCPEGIAKVNYQLQALTPVIDAAQGVVGLNSTSSAVGIGLQIKDENGMPVPLNTPRTFTAYNAAGGNFQIPLSASYYRLFTGSLRPGSANAEVTFIMSYL